MQTKLILAPMLGITDQVFRASFANFFPGFDEAYAPFIKVNQLGDFKASKMRELIPNLNRNLKVTPQIMCNHAGAFIDAAKHIADMGYESINWNLGCPSPSSSSRNLGCGLMPDPDFVDKLLNDILAQLPMSLSIKTRLGLTYPHEILKLSTVFNRYPLDHVIIHPRTGKQGYSGQVDLDGFSQAHLVLKMPIYFSGDITSEKVFWDLKNRFPLVKGFLIGRGALLDPLICHKIKKSGEASVELNLEHYRDFIEDLWCGYHNQGLSGKDITIKIRTIFYYFASANSFSKRKMRKIRKARNALDFSQILLDDPDSNGPDHFDDESGLLDSEKYTPDF